MEVENDQELEKKHFCKIVTAFKSYRKLMLKRVDDKKTYIGEMSTKHQKLLEGYLLHLEEVKKAILQNAEIINLIIQDVDTMFENVQHELTESYNLMVLSGDLDKVQSTLKQIVRDWSSYGEIEREACYGPIIRKIEVLFPKVDNIQILVPGAGLGRLAFELAKRGYTCQGNEFSLFMLFASNFVLNRLKGFDCHTIYPWLHSGSNMMKNEYQMGTATFPDCDPSDIPSSASFTMAAGDFIDVYTEHNSWDCIATSFFIDCANNIVQFLESIYNILKPGGYWINLGPLLYHFSDQVGENSIEPSYEIIREIISELGFIIHEEESDVKTTYTQQKTSMIKYEYSSVFFVVQKPNVNDN